MGEVVFLGIDPQQPGRYRWQGRHGHIITVGPMQHAQLMAQFKPRPGNLPDSVRALSERMRKDNAGVAALLQNDEAQNVRYNDFVRTGRMHIPPTPPHIPFQPIGPNTPVVQPRFAPIGGRQAIEMGPATPPVSVDMGPAEMVSAEDVARERMRQRGMDFFPVGREGRSAARALSARRR